MDITCYNCKTTYEVPTGTMRKARMMYALGSKEHAFTCPNCGAKNGLTYDEFHSYDHPQNVVPVTGTQSRPGPADKEQSISDRQLVGHAPTNPVEEPGPAIMQRQAIVRVRGVEARRDHSNGSEVMGAFSQGEMLTIVDMWTDGENTWVKLGPERWVELEQDGETVLDLID